MIAIVVKYFFHISEGNGNMFNKILKANFDLKFFQSVLVKTLCYINFYVFIF